MNGFINHLLNRHTNTGRQVLPRLPSRFEQSDTIQENTNETDAPLPLPFTSTHPKKEDHDRDKASESNNDGMKRNTSSFNPVLNTGKVNRDGLDFPSADIVDELAISSLTQKDNINNQQPKVQQSVVANSNDQKSENQDPIRSRGIAEIPDIEVHPNITSSAILGGDFVKFGANGKSIFGENRSFAHQSSVFPQQRKDSNANPSFFEDQQPVIKVTIGRIDVKAIISAPPSKKDIPMAQKPMMSLDEYLKKRDGNK